jgi:ribosomal protein L10
MTMKEVDDVRAKAREAGGEMHVVKNTLFSIVMDQLGIDGKEYLTRPPWSALRSMTPPRWRKL